MLLLLCGDNDNVILLLQCYCLKRSCGMTTASRVALCGGQIKFNYVVVVIVVVVVVDNDLLFL